MKDIFTIALEQMNEATRNMKAYNEAINSIEPQTWPQEHVDVLTNDMIKLKSFTSRRNSRNAVLIYTPKAGHHSNIGFKAVQHYIDNTDYDVYAIEHLAATQETKDAGFSELVQIIDDAYKAIGRKKLHLVGQCQGGVPCSIWAALNTKKTASLIVMGSPIDPTASGGKIQTWLSIMTDQFIENTIQANDGIWAGENQLNGFKALNPADRYFGRFADLWNMIQDNDTAGIKKWRRNYSWYETVLDLPGQMIREVIRHFRTRDLVDGKMTVQGRRVDLSKITCPVATVTGGADDITNGDQCRNLLDHVSSEIKIDTELDGHGHIAIFLTGTSMQNLDSIIKAFEA